MNDLDESSQVDGLMSGDIDEMDMIDGGMYLGDDVIEEYAIDEELS